MAQLNLISTILVLIAVTSFPNSTARSTEDRRIANFRKNPVIQLTDSNFDDTVLHSNKDNWLVAFYAPWCIHSKRLALPLSRAAFHLTQETERRRRALKIGAVDCTANARLDAKFASDGYPTVILFPRGNETEAVAVDRTLSTPEEILEWAFKALTKIESEENNLRCSSKQSDQTDDFKYDYDD